MEDLSGASNWWSPYLLPDFPFAARNAPQTGGQNGTTTSGIDLPALRRRRPRLVPQVVSSSTGHIRRWLFFDTTMKALVIDFKEKGDMGDITEEYPLVDFSVFSSLPLLIDPWQYWPGSNGQGGVRDTGQYRSSSHQFGSSFEKTTMKPTVTNNFKETKIDPGDIKWTTDTGQYRYSGRQFDPFYEEKPLMNDCGVSQGLKVGLGEPFFSEILLKTRYWPRSNGQGGVGTARDTVQYRPSGRFGSFLNETIMKPTFADSYKGFIDKIAMKPPVTHNVFVDKTTMKPTINFKDMDVDPGSIKGMTVTGQYRYSDPFHEAMKRSIRNNSDVFKEMKVDPGDTGQYPFAGVQSEPMTKLRVESDYEDFKELNIDPGDTKDIGQHGSSCRQSELLFAPPMNDMDTGLLNRGPVDEPAEMQPVVDHISRSLANIRANTFYIAHWEEPDNSAPNIHQLYDFSAIIEIWEEIESRVQRPAEFLSIWRHVEEYEEFIYELRRSIGGSANMMTEDMANDFHRRLSGFVRDFKANANAKDDGAPRPSQAVSNVGSSSFFKDIGNVRILGGSFVMNNQQADNKYFAQLEIYLKVITNCAYLQVFVVLF